MDLCHIAKIGIYKWNCNHIGLKLTAINNKGEILKDLDDIKEYFALQPKGTLSMKEISRGNSLWMQGKLSLKANFIKDYTIDRNIYTTFKQLSDITILHKILEVLKDDIQELNQGLDDRHTSQLVKTIDYNDQTHSALSENTKQLLKRAEEQVLSYNTATDYFQKSNIIRSYDVNQICKDCKDLLEDYKKKGIKVTKKPKLDNCRGIVKSPIDKYYIFPGGGMYKKDNIRQWFGLKSNNIKEAATAYEAGENPIHHGTGKAYYKFFSRYHNCAGYVRYLLEATGIRAFKDTSYLERFGVTDTAKFKTYIENINNKIHIINTKADMVFKDIIECNTTNNVNINTVMNELNKHHLSSDINKFSSSNLDTKIKILITSVDYIHRNYTCFSKDTREYIMNLIISTYN